MYHYDVNTALEELKFFSEDFQQSAGVACHVSLRQGRLLQDGDSAPTLKTILKPIVTTFRDLCYEAL